MVPAQAARMPGPCGAPGPVGSPQAEAHAPAARHCAQPSRTQTRGEPMTVEIIAESTPELIEAMERLIPQLSRSAPALTAEQCEAFVAQDGV